MRKLLGVLFIMIISVSMVGAQDDDTTTTSANTTSTASSSINIFFVACEDRAVLNFDGTMLAGWDIYYQLYSGAAGSGTELSSLRQVAVSGDYAVSDQVNYTGGTLASGATGSARVLIAREGNPASVDFETTVSDVQDGCNSPQHTLANSADAGTLTTTTTTATGTVRSPFGDFLALDTEPNPIVVIGAPRQTGRSNKPGEIFAECDNYRPQADPGIVYDTDPITIFWSWYAKTPEQVQDHIEKSNYQVKFQTAPLIDLQVSPIEKRGANYWVFYYAQLGNLTPGTYGVEFKLSWNAETTDGYSTFGPGTDNVSYDSTCTFEVLRHPYLPQDGLAFNQIYSVRD